MLSRGRGQLDRIDHRRAGGNVVAAWAMTALAGNPAFREGRCGVGVLGANDRLTPARMALQASRQNRPRQIGIVEGSESRRGFPRSRTAVVGDGSLVEEPGVAHQVAAGSDPASNEILQL